jgi:TonB family protein
MRMDRFLRIASTLVLAAAAACASVPQPPALPLPPPKAVMRIAPVYPEVLRREGVEGAVVLWLHVNERGEVIRIEEKSSTHPLLSEAAVRALSQWQFEVEKRNGKPVAFVVEQKVEFTLPDPQARLA